MQRYPENTNASIENFRNSGWKTAIDSCDREGYPSLWQSLSAAARDSIEKGQDSEGKVLWLLADACSMMLSPSSVNEPFKPFAVMDGKRSSLPEDFWPPDVDLFSKISEEVDDVWLKARLADLVWLLQKPRSHKHALLAIDAYRLLPLDTETWLYGGLECWQRAISLTRMLRAGSGDRMNEMEAKIITAFKTAKKEDGFLALWLSDLLDTNGLGKNNSVDIAKTLESLAMIFDGEGDLHLSLIHISEPTRPY